MQAAISAMNVHLGRHGKDLVEISVGPQASAGGGNNPSVGAQAQAEIHVSATFSITASTSVAAAAPEPGKDPDDGSLRLSKPGSSVDIDWSPMSLGVLYKLGGKEPPREAGQGSEYYEALMPGKDLIPWVAGQLDPSEFTARNGEARGHQGSGHRDVRRHGRRQGRRGSAQRRPRRAAGAGLAAGPRPRTGTGRPAARRRAARLRATCGRCASGCSTCRPTARAPSASCARSSCRSRAEAVTPATPPAARPHRSGPGEPARR